METSETKFVDALAAFRLLTKDSPVEMEMALIYPKDWSDCLFSVGHSADPNYYSVINDNHQPFLKIRKAALIYFHRAVTDEEDDRWVIAFRNVDNEPVILVDLEGLNRRDKVLELSEVEPNLGVAYHGFTCAKCGGHYFGTYSRSNTGHCQSRGYLNFAGIQCDFSWDRADKEVEKKVINEMTREEHLAQMEQIFGAIGQFEDFMKEFGGGEQQQNKSEEKAG